MTEVSVSIIIPSYNRPTQILDCVMSLAKIDYPPHLLDIIVVDDGSPTPITSTLDGIDIKFPLQVIRQENQGISAARNTGIAQATGDLILFTDDDCRPDAQMINALVSAHKNAPTAMLGGRIENGLPDNIYSTAYQLQVAVTYAYFNRDALDMTTIAGNCMAMPRAILDKVGFFLVMGDGMGAEDREFLDRWRWQGYLVHYVDSAVIYHFHELTLRKLLRQHWTYGKAAHYYRKMTHERKSEGSPFMLGYYAVILKQFFAPGISMPIHKSVRVGMLLVLSQVVYISSALFAMLRDNSTQSSS